MSHSRVWMAVVAIAINWLCAAALAQPADKGNLSDSEGHGVPRNEAQAAAWFQQAAAQGDENAKMKLAQLDELHKVRKNRVEFFAVLTIAGVVTASMVAYRVTRKSAPAHESTS